MFDNTPHPKGIQPCQQALAALLYFAEQTKNLKNKDYFTSDSPPVFVLDAHRSGRVYEYGDVNNSYICKPEDFPKGEKLKALGITKVVHIGEWDSQGKIYDSSNSPAKPNDDLKSILKNWESVGIEVLYAGTLLSEGFFHLKEKESVVALMEQIKEKFLADLKKAFQKQEAPFSFLGDNEDAFLFRRRLSNLYHKGILTDDVFFGKRLILPLPDSINKNFKKNTIKAIQSAA